MTVKQEGPLPTPKPSIKSTPEVENKENTEEKVESKESQQVPTPEASTTAKENIETNENAES